MSSLHTSLSFRDSKSVYIPLVNFNISHYNLAVSRVGWSYGLAGIRTDLAANYLCVVLVGYNSTPQHHLLSVTVVRHFVFHTSCS